MTPNEWLELHWNNTIEYRPSHLSRQYFIETGASLSLYILSQFTHQKLVEGKLQRMNSHLYQVINTRTKDGIYYAVKN